MSGYERAFRLEMKYTMRYLKIVVMILLVLAMLAALCIGAGSLFVGVIGFLAEGDLSYLVFVLVSVFCGFVVSVLFDVLMYLDEKWEVD